MDVLFAYCGLSCETCPIYLATIETDKARQIKLREAISEKCREVYGFDLRSEDIGDCDGCRAETGRIFKGCLDCQIRNCARGKKLESCAFCNDYVCENLVKHFAVDPGARVRLEEVRVSQQN